MEGLGNGSGATRKLRIGIIASHPIQYQAPWFRGLAEKAKVKVWFAHQPSAKQQGEGFGKAFTWDVDLLSGYDHGFLKNIAKNPDSSQFGGCDTPVVAERIKEENYDAVILCGWHLKTYLQALRVCKKLGIPVLVRGDSQLVTPRSRLKTWIKEPMYRWFLSKFDGFLSVGVRNREYLRHYGVPDEKIFFAPHFVDNDWFAAKAEDAKAETAMLRKYWGARENDIVAAFVGKFEPKKRPGDLLEAAALVTEGKVRVVLIGSGELEKALRSRAAALQAPVVFAGFKNQSELPACYAAMDVIVLPSDGGETWGLVINEAMACGVPAIVSDACGCMPDLIKPGITGYAFPAGDTHRLSQCLNDRLIKKQSNYNWKASLEELVSQYSVERCVERTLAAVLVVTQKRTQEGR